MNEPRAGDDALNEGGARVASFEEVSAELNQVISKSEQANAALAQAGGLAEEAAALIATAMQGTGHLEAERSEVVRNWSEVAERSTELAQALEAGCEAVERYRQSLCDDLSPRPLPAAPRPRSSVPDTSTPETTWIERQRAQLPTYVTSGFYRDEDGNSDLVQSGSEPSGEDRDIARHLVASGRVRPRTFPTVAQHVEIKVGWRMRASGVERAEVVVNNQLCEGRLSCFELLPDLLLPGQTLVVHDPVRSHTFNGKGSK